MIASVADVLLVEQLSEETKKAILNCYGDFPEEDLHNDAYMRGWDEARYEMRRDILNIITDPNITKEEIIRQLEMI